MKLQTISGRILSPRRPLLKDIDINDIAHALNNLCRFAGHLPNTYSVAAHSLAVCRVVERMGGTPRECLTALLHDASEAYCVDLPTPIKRLCKDYQKIEDRFQKVIAKKFGLIYPFPKMILKADKAVLYPEKVYQTFGDDFGLGYVGRDCKKEFLRRFYELGGKNE